MTRQAKDYLRRWRSGPFSCVLWDTHRRDWRGQSVIGYRFRSNGKIIMRREILALRLQAQPKAARKRQRKPRP